MLATSKMEQQSPQTPALEKKRHHRETNTSFILVSIDVKSSSQNRAIVAGQITKMFAECVVVIGYLREKCTNCTWEVYTKACSFCTRVPCYRPRRGRGGGTVAVAGPVAGDDMGMVLELLQLLQLVLVLESPVEELYIAPSVMIVFAVNLAISHLTLPI